MCGILGYYGKTKPLIDFKQSLLKLKHRGQDGYDIKYIDNDGFIKDYEENKASKSIVGHTQYTTSSKSNPVKQPYSSRNAFGRYSLLFNGNIPTENGESDTLMIVEFLNKNTGGCVDWYQLLAKLLTKYKRAYSLIIHTSDKMYAVRDTYGVRPFYLLYSSSECYFSSEIVIFNQDEQNRYIIKEINAGDIYSIDVFSGLKLFKNTYSSCQSHCLFEYIYFSKNESVFDTMKIETYRAKIGVEMAKKDENIFTDDYIVCGVPATGNHYAASYAKHLGLSHKDYIKKNRNVDRTFILKNDKERNHFASIKYHFSKGIIKKKIILIDDSLVRGITMNNLVERLYKFGVVEVHIRIASPPITNTCEYGIDIPTKNELIFKNRRQIQDEIKCNSIKYLNLEDNLNMFKNPNDKCTKCLYQKPIYDW